MKRYIYLLGVLLLFCNNIRGQGGFNPNDPPEPNVQYNLVLQASPNGAGSLYGAGKYAAGTGINVYTYNSTGFKFVHWTENGNVISIASSFHYTMPAANAVLTAVFEYAPGNPGEPNPTPLKYALNLVAQPAVAGSFNISSGSRYDEGASVYLYAYTNTGFKFKEWRKGDDVLSTSRNYYYTIPGENTTVTAIYYYDPDTPAEPNTPTDTEHGLIALNQSGDPGQTIVFPIYLLNHNISVHSVEFDITFPEGATVNHAGAFLTDRGSGQTVSAVPKENNGFHFSIAGESSAPFSGSNGILLQIPVTLPAQWIPDETYPVKIENVQIGTPGGTVASSGKSGSLSINPGADYTVLANFYSNKFLNRVHFINLSSETATQFKWSFGDGNTSEEREPLHVYNASGSYEVQLIASNAQKADTVKAQVEIAAENTWNISGTISLNKHKKDVKNFTSVGELFRLLSRSNQSGNLTTDVEAGETFECDLSVEIRNILTTVKNKLAGSNQILIFRKDGAAGEPVISFTGTFSSESAQAAAQLGQYIELNGVVMKIYNMPVDIRQISGYTPQKVCSGNTSTPVDFTKIGSAFTYKWTLVSSPGSVTGYPVSGSGVIPAATLTTTSPVADTLTYKVSVMSATPVIELHSFEYRIIVIPDMQGVLTLLSPEANELLTSSEVTFSWSEIPNASYYEIKVWEEYDDEPGTAMATNIKSLSYRISAFFQYGKKYNCKVIAVNECKRIESAAVLFAIRQLPDLHVTEIEAPEAVYSSSEVKIIYRVQNDGLGATLTGEHWYDRIGLIWDMKNPSSNVHWLIQKQNKSALGPGEFYRDTLTIKIPERISGNWYVVVTSDMPNILSVDWSPAGNTVPLPYTPNKNGIPYPYLNAQTSANGNLIPEDKETVTLTDNFFYTITEVKISKLPDLKVVSVEVPDSVAESRTFTVSATITNAGDSVLSGKTWSDGVWQSKSPDFSTSTASLAAYVSSSRTVEIGDSYTVSFELVAPVDSAANYYYFVMADLNDDVYESDETNNRLRSVAVAIKPSQIDEADYANLTRIFNEFGGQDWINKWKTGSNRIGDHWPGVTFIQGQVRAIALTSNNLTGEISDVFLRFPHLNTLNLYDNQLTGSISSLLSGESVPDSLAYLNLGKNQLAGSIPASIAKLGYLEELNVSYNRLSEIDSALPKKIVRLNIQSQTLPSDSIDLSPQPVLNVPSIARYNHADGSFETYPSHGLYRNPEQRLLLYVHNGTYYNWQLNQSNPKDFIWYSEPEYEFSLIQESGLAQGSAGKLKLGFRKGDANIDRQTDVLDVQHSLNFIFNEHVSAFNFTAADTYKDNSVTIQDLIKTIDIILDSNRSSELPLRSDALANRIFIRDGKLAVYTEQAVAAMDVSLQGISEKEIRPLLADSEFQFVFRDSGDGTRFIFFSPNGDNIPPGNTNLAELHKNGAAILHITASGPSAESVPVKIESSPTGIIPVKMDEITAFAAGGTVYYHLPENVTLVSASLYSVQGMIVERQDFGASQPETQRLDFNIRRPGIYLLNLVVKSNHRVFSKNIKLIVTK